MAGEPTKRMHETWLWCLATLSCGLVGLIFTTVWAAPEPLPSFAVSQEPRFGIVVRTFWKDEDRMTQYLLPNIRMFVNRDMFDFVVVLDDESSADHRYGHCLEKESFTVKYESYPPDSSIFQGVAWMGFKSKGYDRQQWSTFHLDLQSEREILGAIDSDACIFTYLTEASVLTNDGRIILRALSTRDSYVADQDALGFDTPFNFMWYVHFFLTFLLRMLIHMPTAGPIACPSGFGGQPSRQLGSTFLPNLGISPLMRHFASFPRGSTRSLT